MAFTTAEKLQLFMLCDIAKPAAERELDYDFIFSAIATDDIWALAWRYHGWNLDEPTPPRVQQVCDILDMWDCIERDFEELSATEKARVKAQSYRTDDPRFLGFDGNNETELMHIAGLLVGPLERWARFKDRGLNSHMPSVDLYERMLVVWRPLWERKIKQVGNYKLSPDEIIDLLRERIHPSRRKNEAGGGWTFREGY